MKLASGRVGGGAGRVVWRCVVPCRVSHVDAMRVRRATRLRLLARASVRSTGLSPSRPPASPVRREIQFAGSVSNLLRHAAVSREFSRYLPLALAASVSACVGRKET